jgi:hypothetical protein
MEYTIAIDPGKRTGWAEFHDSVLKNANAMHSSSMLASPPMPPQDPWAVRTVVIELPQVYPFGQGKGDPNQLITLAVIVGDLRGFYRRQGCIVQLVKPRTWKGTVPKKIHNERVLRKLSSEELDILPKRPRAKDYDHNMVDAIGLGLWALQRMTT